MRLTSTGLGIGTSSPGQRLAVRSADNTGTTIVGRFESNNGNQAVGIRFNGVRGLGGALSLGTDGAASITFEPNNTERMVLDSSGNLGLGVTPSAWGSGQKALQTPAGAIWNFNDANMTITQNAFSDGTEKYINNGFASKYNQNSGQHTWSTAASGTAGNAISFTQAMTLDASGNLIVGGTSPVISGAGRGNITINGSSTAVMALSVGGSAKGWVYHDNTNLEINAGSAGAMIMYTAGSERARITSGGDLLVGTTATTIATITQNALVAKASNGSLLIHHEVGNTGSDFAAFGYNGAVIGSIYPNSASTVAYATSSDYRLKNTVAPMTGALAKVALLKPCTYKWNADGSDGQGFIAHELAEVVPDCVVGEKDAVDAEGKPRYQGVDTSFLVATLTAAIQELTARVAQLESK
jgi:hypothetical protein